MVCAITIAVGLESTLLSQLSKQGQQNPSVCPNHIKCSFFSGFCFRSTPQTSLLLDRLLCKSVTGINQLRMEKLSIIYDPMRLGPPLRSHSNISFSWAQFTLCKNVRRNKPCTINVFSHTQPNKHIQLLNHTNYPHSLANIQNTAVVETNAVIINFTHFHFL